MRLCEQVGLATTKKSKKGERGAKQNIQGFDNFFQLAFRDGDLWEHQEDFFKLWEEGKVKGQRVKLPTSAQRARAGSEEALKPISEDMKITPWRFYARHPRETHRYSHPCTCQRRCIVT